MLGQIENQEEDLLKPNEAIYSAFFKDYNILSHIPPEMILEDFQDGHYPKGLFDIQGFHKIVQNEFEANIYAELSTDEKQWYFLGHKELFIELIRTSCRSFKPNNLPSENFKNLSFFALESYSKIEVIYFYNSCQKWIKWVREGKRWQHIHSAQEKQEILITNEYELENSLAKLYYLIDMFIEHYRNHPSSRVDLEKVTSTFADPKQTKFEKLLKIISFLNPNNNENEPYMVKEDFEKLSEYFYQLIFEGRVNFEKDDPFYRIERLKKRDITYTFFLSNEFLFRDKRNLEIYRILSYCNKNDFSNIRQSIKNRNIRNHTVYKDFKHRTNDYVNHNPNYITK